ncbi:MAG: ScyD/ScyE family protein [Ginsengibacter sp.]
MKFCARNSASKQLAWFVAFAALLFLFEGCKKGNVFPKLTVNTVASGLAGPIGIETDNYGNIWVSEGGTFKAPDENGSTANNDGKVVVITPKGQVYDAIINLSSFQNVHSGQLQGTVHMLRDAGKLYILSGDGMYTADISHFKPGDKPIDANTLPYEDIAKFASNIPSANNPEKDSHPYNLTKGPDGDLYIADAGANAIIHRRGPGNYSILAEVPGFSNPTNPLFGPPNIQAVPTSIWYDGHNFLVTTLTGFPFVSGLAVIYKISMSGNVSVYQSGFTTLVDLAEGNGEGHIAVQHGIFNPATEFTPNSGSLVWANGSVITTLVGGLNQPVGIKQYNDHTWYVTSLGDGTVLKVNAYN